MTEARPAAFRGSVMPLPTLKTVTLTIPSGQTANAAGVDLGDGMLVGFVWPAAMTGTGVTITAAPTLAGTYGSVYDTTDTIVGALTKHNDAYRALDPAVFAGVRFVKFTSSGAEGADRVFTLLVRN
jgi:hypothetical protein